jgi:hypothetical protein
MKKTLRYKTPNAVRIGRTRIRNKGKMFLSLPSKFLLSFKVSDKLLLNSMKKIIMVGTDIAIVSGIIDKGCGRP